MTKFFSLVVLSSLVILQAFDASAKECAIRISANDQMQFDKKEIRIAKDCVTIKVTIVNAGKMPVMAMGHNWVLTKTSDWNAVATAEAKAIPPSPQHISKDKRIIAATSFVGGGAGEPKEASVTIKRSSLKEGESYHFFCSFPGHFALMNGPFILEK